MSIEGQGQFFTIYFPGFVCFVLYLDKISGERLQDHWSSGYYQCESMENLTSHTFVLVNACFVFVYRNDSLFMTMYKYEIINKTICPRCNV